MKKKATLKLTSAILGIAVLVSGCASSTVLSTTPSDADIYIQGQRLGKTPYTYSDRKIAGASTMVTFKKEGYEDYNTTIRKNKKLNVGALLSGLLLVYPLFWVLGYDKAHSYDLEEEVAVAEQVAVPEPAKKEIAASVAPANDLPDYGNLPTSSRIEKLLSERQIEKAVEYADDQDGAFQAGCYYAIAQYYLDNNDLQAAEDFFNRSGKSSEGNVRIAEALMRGEVIDSVVVIDEQKIRSYLAKEYDSEDEITGKMAACYEKYANESKDRIALAKKMKDMGMISMSSGGKTLNIDRSLTLARVLAIVYLNSAVQAYKELGDTEKVQVLQDEIDTLYKEFGGKPGTTLITAADSTEKILPAVRDDKYIRSASPEMKLTAEDDRVFFSVDSVARLSTQPQDLVKALKYSNSSLASRPARNADYVLVYFNKTVKEALNLTSYKHYLANITLSDQLGKNYAIILERGHNYIRTPGGGQILWNPAAPHSEGVIINYSYMMFYMPVESTPIRLNYVYNYKNDKDNRKPSTETLTIDLTQ
jgi:hypothetical protein